MIRQSADRGGRPGDHGSGRPGNGQLVGNDSDPDGDAIELVSFGGDGDPPAPGGTIFNNQFDGRVDVIPPSDFSGVFRFTYLIRDEHGAEATATVTITVADTTGETIHSNGFETLNPDPG